jgi:TusA-related sulfurtransferase
MDREPGIMGSHYHIDLEHLPWPVSVLKFNGTVSDMRSGDDMTATLRDPDVVGNLCQLLSSQADLLYEVQQTDSEFRIKVVKGSPGQHEKRL